MPRSRGRFLPQRQRSERRKIRGRFERIFEKRRLADAGIAVHDEHRTFATSRRGQHLIEHCLLAMPADQLPNAAWSLHRARER